MGILQKISKKTDEDQAGKKSVSGTKEAKSADKGKKDKAVAKDQKKVESKVQRQVNPEHNFAYRAILGPVLTEKGEMLKVQSKYAFFVEVGVNKVEVARAIKALYGVDPVSVRMISLKGKRVRHGRSQGRRKDRKKAIVTLKSGDSISLTESA